jgi:hypothetical protein
VTTSTPRTPTAITDELAQSDGLAHATGIVAVATMFVSFVALVSGLAMISSQDAATPTFTEIHVESFAD